MSQEVIAFTIDALRQMNFDVDGAGEQTVLGPAGIDLDSLAVAELALRIEDGFGVKFAEEDVDGLATMTLGEFAADVAGRAGGSGAAGRAGGSGAAGGAGPAGLARPAMPVERAGQAP
jgi:acyl carrier protein